jgi:hypothetical protein
MASSVTRRVVRIVATSLVAPLAFFVLALSFGVWSSFGIVRDLSAQSWDCVACQGTWACITSLSSCRQIFSGCKPNTNGVCYKSTGRCCQIVNWKASAGKCATYTTTFAGAYRCISPGQLH